MDKSLGIISCVVFFGWIFIAGMVTENGSSEASAVAWLSYPALCVFVSAVGGLVYLWQLSAPKRRERREAARQRREAARQRAAARTLADRERRTERERLRQERATETRIKNEVNGARAAVEGLYREHAELLRESFPRLLFQASLNSKIPDDSTPANAWAAAKTLMAQMVKLVTERKQQLIRQEEAEMEKRKSMVPVTPVSRPRINPEDV